MADVNINTNSDLAIDDKIGNIFIEGHWNYSSSHAGFHKSVVSDHNAPVYLGETIKYDIILKKSTNVHVEEWKRVITRVTSQAKIVPLYSTSNLTSKVGINIKNDVNDIAQKVSIKIEESINDGILCPVLETNFGISGSSHIHDGSFKPYFRDDATYVIPMSSSLQHLAGDCHLIELHATLLLYTVTNSDRSVEVDDGSHQMDSPISDVSDDVMPAKRKIPVNIKEFFDFEDERDVGQTFEGLDAKTSPVKVSSSIQSVQEKSVTMRLIVQGPPEIKMRHSMAGPKPLLLLKVSNCTDKQMVIKSIQILSSSSPISDNGLAVYEDKTSVKRESCHQLINLEVPKKSQTFPVILSPCEALNLIYKLNLSSVPSDSELSLRANVKWTHAGASHEITTLYKLPRIKVRCPPFIVTVKCDEDVELGKTFFVTYSISNQLHDFMSMKLYYNLDNMFRAAQENGSQEEFNRIQDLKNSIVCHDLDTAVSACPKGSCVPIRVGFQIHKPGLYELSELMKVNLRYSLPDPHLTPVQDDRESLSTSSDTSVSIQSFDDHMLASEELWRGRSGSTASMATPEMYLTAEERRRSFASKSYSFGDLGPTVSAESDEAGRRIKGTIQRSSAVPPPRPPPPRMLSQTERDLIKPSNFLKQPFYIYVRDPLI